MGPIGKTGVLRSLPAGSRLAISVSLSREHDDGARARFQARVAALGEPARSAFTADEAEDLLTRTRWRVLAGREETAARRERLRAAGLLVGGAGPRASPQPPEGPRGPKGPEGPKGPLPLSALLSQVLVAFTIECDNEAEHGLPHRTSDHGPSGQGDGPWLTSLTMWENCMRYVTGEPITVAELEARARTGTNLDGMRRWGYITIDGTARKAHRGRPGPDAVLRATAGGLRAHEVWRSLPGLVEQCWRDRLGPDQVGRLRAALIAMAGQLDPGLPDCLPILGATLFSRGPDPALPRRQLTDTALERYGGVNARMGRVSGSREAAMGLRLRRRNLVVWSSGRSGHLGSPIGRRPERPRRIPWWLRAGALLMVIGILRLARSARARWEPVSLLVGALLMVTGFLLPAMAGAFLLGVLVLIVTLLKGIGRQGRTPVG